MNLKNGQAHGLHQAPAIDSITPFRTIMVSIALALGLFGTIMMLAGRFEHWYHAE